jgi:cytochrome b6-f complex iron-sulfur subunit
MDHSNQPTRRGFLDAVIAFGTAITAAALALPGLLYLWPAARGGASEDVEVKGAASMSPGDHTVLQVRGKAVILVRGSQGFTAHSAVCSHLGCLVKWDAGRQEFLCPCHAAVFDKDGNIVSGPAPEGLAPYKVKEVGDRVYVSAA